MDCIRGMAMAEFLSNSLIDKALTISNELDKKRKPRGISVDRLARSFFMPVHRKAQKILSRMESLGIFEKRGKNYYPVKTREESEKILQENSLWLS